MKTKLVSAAVLALLLPGCGQAPGPERDQWEFRWRTKSLADDPPCVLVSGARLFRTHYGSKRVTLGVRGDGRVFLYSPEEELYFSAPERFTIRVDDRPALSGIEMGSNSKTGVFSARDSAALLEQFPTGREAKISAAFMPQGETLTKTFPLSGFGRVQPVFEDCRALQAAGAWAGFAVTERAGAGIMGVDADSPAGRAGLRQSDIITAINGAPATLLALAEALRRLASGAALTLQVRRGEQVMEVELIRP